MKMIGRKMSLLMGVTLSFFLSLIGLLSSGKFNVMSWIISFMVSTIISLIIGFLVPMKKINDSVEEKHGKGLKSKLIEALFSDLIYTPFITTAMIFMAYMQAKAHHGNMPFLPVWIKSLIISMVAGYILIMIFMPIFMKLVMKGQPPK
ncbi:MAG: hypothetical protein K6G11_01855 [Lachnospiraceae bacterium]|nr:hypothetical protein [Lachnospiraceae bacterium]